jgi:hypothetical protein
VVKKVIITTYYYRALLLSQQNLFKYTRMAEKDAPQESSITAASSATVLQALLSGHPAAVHQRESRFWNDFGRCMISDESGESLLVYV